MVRSNMMFPRSNSRSINQVDSPPAAGIFVKVSSKPTNHSKFTGKCGTARCLGCHTHPASKSKEKAKGTHKPRSCPVDKGQGLNYDGKSASGLLGHLDNDEWDGEVEDDDDDDDWPCIGYGSAAESGCPKEEDKTGSGRSSSFSDLGLVWDQVEEDEGWFLVGVM
ncbi:hypothetical protein HHK36_029503 [Tetracentron sinense]|uniref:Uncharacterized protein n=1 Tax=Tetracentron sinense TaxID=13715 RepID=A0A834YE41_TETSI|nr:hypothetical protein HHK36_029503 [Tetracentron sinense]